jgi:hypothetical protein
VSVAGELTQDGRNQIRQICTSIVGFVVRRLMPAYEPTSGQKTHIE